MFIVLNGRAAHEVKGAMIGCGAEGHKQAILAEGAELITDAFFGRGSGSSNGFTKLLEGGSLFLLQRGEIIVDVLRFFRRFGRTDFWHGVNSKF